MKSAASASSSPRPIPGGAHNLLGLPFMSDGDFLGQTKSKTPAFLIEEDLEGDSELVFAHPSGDEAAPAALRHLFVVPTAPRAFERDAEVLAKRLPSEALKALATALETRDERSLKEVWRSVPDDTVRAALAWLAAPRDGARARATPYTDEELDAKRSSLVLGRVKQALAPGKVFNDPPNPLGAGSKTAARAPAATSASVKRIKAAAPGGPGSAHKNALLIRTSFDDKLAGVATATLHRVLHEIGNLFEARERVYYHGGAVKPPDNALWDEQGQRYTLKKLVPHHHKTDRPGDAPSRCAACTMKIMQTRVQLALRSAPPEPSRVETNHDKTEARRLIVECCGLDPAALASEAWL